MLHAIRKPAFFGSVTLSLSLPLHLCLDVMLVRFIMASAMPQGKVCKSKFGKPLPRHLYFHGGHHYFVGLCLIWLLSRVMNVMV